MFIFEGAGKMLFEVSVSTDADFILDSSRIEVPLVKLLTTFGRELSLDVAWLVFKELNPGV